MKTFAIDIGGTKFTVAAFDGDKLILRETRSTNREGGPKWMFSQIEQIFVHWREKAGFTPDRCGIGFGGPVDFPSQTVTLSTHVEGWASYPLVDERAEGEGRWADVTFRLGLIARISGRTIELI
jgi:glucokinase